MRLQPLGYNVYDWKHGVNIGPEIDSDCWLRLLGNICARYTLNTVTTVSLIGWSLSGIYARELAKKNLLLVRQVIALGTPFEQPTDDMQGTRFNQASAATFSLYGALEQQSTEASPVLT